MKSLVNGADAEKAYEGFLAFKDVVKKNLVRTGFVMPANFPLAAFLVALLMVYCVELFDFLISHNCPALRKSGIEYYAMLDRIGVHHFNGYNFSLAALLVALSAFSSFHCPALRKSEIEYYAMLDNIGVHHFNGYNFSLAALLVALSASSLHCEDKDPPHLLRYLFWIKSIFHALEIQSVCRGYEVYRQVCATCNSMEQLHFRLLVSSLAACLVALSAFPTFLCFWLEGLVDFTGYGYFYVRLCLTGFELLANLSHAASLVALFMVYYIDPDNGKMNNAYLNSTASEAFAAAAGRH